MSNMAPTVVANLLFLQAVVASSVVPTINLTIGWQSHSWDDLREWPQLFAKFQPNKPRLLKVQALLDTPVLPAFKNRQQSLHAESPTPTLHT